MVYNRTNLFEMIGIRVLLQVFKPNEEVEFVANVTPFQSKVAEHSYVAVIKITGGKRWKRQLSVMSARLRNPCRIVQGKDQTQLKGAYAITSVCHEKEGFDGEMIDRK